MTIFFLAQRAKQVLIKGQSRPQGLEKSLRSGLYLLVCFLFYNFRKLVFNKNSPDNIVSNDTHSTNVHSLTNSLIIFLQIYKTSSIPNPKSWEADILIEYSPPLRFTFHESIDVTHFPIKFRENSKLN